MARLEVNFYSYTLKHGVDFTWHPIDGYGREWRYWDMEIASLLEWLPRTDPSADHSHKV